jgi:hypothetical protein
MSDTPHPTPARADGRRGRLPAILAITGATILELIVLVPFTVASGLVAPMWAVVVIYALGVSAVAMLVAVARRRPLLAPIVPIVHAAALWGIVTFGELVLGWTG